MDSSLFNFIRQVAATQEEEILCSECLDLVSKYVDLELAGEEAEQALQPLKQHLEQCRACREEYELLRDLARMEAEGRLPAIEELRDQLE